MPRPQLAVGDYGSISYSGGKGEPWVAMARYRDVDGETRRVKAQGSSKSGAAAALKAKFKDRAKSGDSELSNESTVMELAEKYYAVKLEEDLAPNTMYNLRRTLDNHVIPKLGKLRIREVTPQRVQGVVSTITKSNGPGTGLMVRSALSGMFASAVRWGAAQTNAVQYTSPPKMSPKEIRALTIPELLRLRAHAVERLRPFSFEERLGRFGDRSRMGGKNRSQVPLDVMDFLLGTGCRAGEALGTAWEDVHLDDPVPWVKIHQQVIREVGVGLRLTPTKERDQRFLRLPGFAVEMLRRRQELATGAMVFPNERGGLIAPANMAVAWRRVFEGTEWSWVTQKTLRKTVATLVDAEHGSGLASKQLGHASDVMTKRFYIAQSAIPIDTGSVLELFDLRGDLESGDIGA